VAGDQVEQRGLAGAVGADDGVQRAPWDLQGHVLDGVDAAEGAVEALGPEDEVGHPALRVRRSMCGTVVVTRPHSPWGKISTQTTKIAPTKNCHESVYRDSVLSSSR
jgi:hypothetical protein